MITKVILLTLVDVGDAVLSLKSKKKWKLEKLLEMLEIKCLKCIGFMKKMKNTFLILIRVVNNHLTALGKKRM